MGKVDVKEIRKALSQLSREDLTRIANEKITKSMSQDELLVKTAITTADIATAGKLSPAQADMFLDFVFNLTKTEGLITTKKFRNDNMYFEVIDTHERVTVAYEEATDPNYRPGVSHNRIPIQPEIVIATGKISDDYILENLQGQTVMQVVLKQLATRFKNNLEEMYLTGNKLGYARVENEIRKGGSATKVRKDNFLAISDGWFTLAAASGIIHDAGASTDLVKIMVSMFRLMPNMAKSPRERLRWLVDPNLWAAYQYLLTLRGSAGRTSGLGDQALDGSLGEHDPFQIKPVELPLLASQPLCVEHVTLNGTTPESLLHKNIVSGSVIVTDTTLDKTAIDIPYVVTTDYTVDLVNGTITRAGGGSIGDGATVKVTYRTPPQLMLKDPKLLLLGIGYDIKVETDRNIFELTNDFVMHTKVDVNDANAGWSVVGHNIGSGLYTP